MRIVAAIAGIFITRALGPQGKGTYLYLTVILAFTMQLTYGDAAAIAWQWGKKHLPPRAVLGASLLIGSAVMLAAAIVIAAMALLSRNPLLWVVVAALPFAVLGQLCAGFFLTEQRVLLLNIQDAITGIGLPIAAVAAVYLFPDRLAAVLSVWIVAQAGRGLFSIIALGRNLRLFPLTTTRAVVSDHARFALQACGQQVLTYFNSRIDIIVVGLALGVATLGVYSVAIASNEFLWMLPRSLSVAAFGRITSANPVDSAALASRCVRQGLLASAFGAALAFLAAPLIPLILGAPFAPAVNALRIVLPGAVVWSCMDVLTVFFSTHFGKPAIALSIQAVSAAICATVTLLLAWKIGINAGALGCSLGYIAGGTLAIALFRRFTGVPLHEIIVPRRADLLAYPSLVASVFGSRSPSNAGPTPR